MLPLGAAVFVLSAGECKHPNSHKTPAAQAEAMAHITAAVMHGFGAQDSYKLDSSLVSLFTIFSCIIHFLIEVFTCREHCRYSDQNIPYYEL